jgi:multidrug resistance protein
MNLSLFFIVLFIACITGFSSDIYTPSLKAIADDLSTSIASTQSTMSLFLIAVALSQMLYGPFSEGHGRKKTLLFGCSIAFIGSVLCIFSANIEMLYLGRLLQASGCGAFAALWRSIFRDALTPLQITRYGGYMGIAMVFIVALAPTIGGYLDTLLSWRASFIAISFYCGALFTCIYFFLPETASFSKDRLNRHFFKKAF